MPDRELLSLAALEGRQFTAEAVAHALGRERDEVVDYLDDVLVERGLVEEVGLITIGSEQGDQHLWQYRFASELDRLTLRQRSPATRWRELSGRLAEGLVAAYGIAGDFISATLARLFEAAGNAELASRFWAQDAGRLRRRRDHVARVESAAGRAAGQPRSSARWRQRRCSRRRGCTIRRPVRRGPRVCRGGAGPRAPERSIDQGSAYFFAGWFRANLGQYAEARRDLERALTFAAPDALAQRADVMHGLANVDFLEGDHAAARRRYEQMLDLARQDGNAKPRRAPDRAR